MDGVGVDECDLEAEETRTRLLVDQLGASIGEVPKGRREVVDLVGDVMHSGPALGEEPADRRVLAERAHQLDPALADPHGDSLDALVVEPAALLDAPTKQPLVRPDRLVEVLDGDAEVMDPEGLHGPDASRAVGACAGWARPPSDTVLQAPRPPALNGLRAL